MVLLTSEQYRYSTYFFGLEAFTLAQTGLQWRILQNFAGTFGKAKLAELSTYALLLNVDISAQSNCTNVLSIRHSGSKPWQFSNKRRLDNLLKIVSNVVGCISGFFEPNI